MGAQGRAGPRKRPAARGAEGRPAGTPPIAVGERFGKRVRFDADAIRRFAEVSGDLNPLHHDDAAGAEHGFPAIIASGPHVVALMMGLDATHFSQRGTALGLRFDFRFVRAIPAGAELTLEWTVTACAHKASLRGWVVDVEGRAFDDAGTVYTTGHGSNLLRLPDPGAPS